MLVLQVRTAMAAIIRPTLQDATLQAIFDGMVTSYQQSIALERECVKRLQAEATLDSIHTHEGIMSTQCSRATGVL